MDKNSTQQKIIKQQPHKKNLYPLIEKENLTDIINVSGPPTTDLKYTVKQVFNLHDPLDTIPLSKIEVENIFLPPTEKITLQLIQKNQNFDPMIRQRKPWLPYKTKPVKADTTILGNKTLLRYFRKLNNTTINENTDILENNTPDSKVPCLPLSMMFIAFNISHIQNTKGHSRSEKNIFKFYTKCLLPKCTNLD